MDNIQRLKIKIPNFINKYKKIEDHEKRMKSLKDDIKNLNNIPESKLNKRYFPILYSEGKYCDNSG